jgi:hypothetical protein
LKELEKYTRMKKAGLPEGAIRHRMMQDGVDPADADLFFGVAPAAPSKKTLDEASLKELEKYTRMKKAGLPEGAIRHRMMQDGVDPAVADLFFGVAPCAGATAVPVKRKSQFQKLHWQMLDDEKLKNSVWVTKVGDTEMEDIDLHELKSMFGNTSPKTLRKKKKSLKSDKDGNQKNIRLLDPKRAYNVEIILSKFRSFENFDAIGVALESQDDALTLDMLLLLKTLYPSDTEVAAMKRYRGDPARLGIAERFMLSIIKVRDGLQKINCSLFVSEFNTHVTCYQNQLDLLTKAADDIIRCDALVQVLRKVLVVGNKMNEGTHSGGARGFTLESLSKLSTTKGADKKTTVLDVVVTMIYKSTASANSAENDSLLREEKKVSEDPFKWIEEDLSVLPQARSQSQRDVQNDILKLIQNTKNYRKLLSDGLFPPPPAGKRDKMGEFMRSAQLNTHALQKKSDMVTRKSEELADYWGEHSRNMPIEKIADTLDQFMKNLKGSVSKAKRSATAQAKSSAKDHGRGNKEGSVAVLNNANAESSNLMGGNRGALLEALKGGRSRALLKKTLAGPRSVRRGNPVLDSLRGGGARVSLKKTTQSATAGRGNPLLDALTGGVARSKLKKNAMSSAENTGGGTPLLAALQGSDARALLKKANLNGGDGLQTGAVEESGKA